MSESEHDRRERLKREAAEELRKEVHHLLTDIRAAATRDGTETGAPVTNTMVSFASLLAVLSAQADIQTRAVIRLTRWLIGLTWAVIFLTLYLCYDAYSKSYEGRTHHQEQNSAKPQ